MASYGWDIVPGRCAMPLAGQTVNGQPFTVPRTALVLVLHIPTLVGAATVKLQSLVPARDDQVADAWQEIAAFNLAAGSPVALSGIPSNAATSIPITATGAGVLRCVASSDQSSAPVEITMSFLCL